MGAFLSSFPFELYFNLTPFCMHFIITFLLYRDHNRKRGRNQNNYRVNPNMQAIELQIELTANYLDPEIEDLLMARSIVYEQDIKPRKYRKKLPPPMREYLSENVPGREKEVDLVSAYIEKMKEGDKSPLCLHGSTGCGKTSIMKELMSYLKKYDKQLRVSYINCLTYTTVKKIYNTILDQLFDCQDKKPQQLLSTLFSTPIDPEESENSMSTQPSLLILDEIDQFFSSKTFIYNILDWIQCSTFPFGVIMISNMVDFSVNVEAKLKSRMKFNSIIFAPYSYDNLFTIVSSKWKNWRNIFDLDAVVYLCKKIAGINSDVRLIQRYYAEAVKKFGGGINQKISVEDVSSLFQTNNTGICKVVNPYKFLLHIFWRSPRGKNILVDVEHYCLGNGTHIYTQNQILYYLYEMQVLGLIKLTRNKLCDLYLNAWGIKIMDYAYTLQAMLK